MAHWCDICHGSLSGNSPCAPEQPELPDRTCAECGAECNWEQTHCPNPECDERLYPTLQELVDSASEY
jgi:hypothetical protein